MKTRLTLTLLATLVSTTTYAKTIDLEYWTLLSGGDGSRMNVLVEGFNNSQADYHINTTVLPWGEPFYTKLKTSTHVGAGPDMATIHLSKISGMVKDHDLVALSPDTLSQYHYQQDHIFPRLLQQATREGEVYALPLDTHALVLYYNTSVLKKAGVIGSDGKLPTISNLEDFNHILKQVVDNTDKEALSMETNPNSYMGYRLWESMIIQQGGQVMTDGKYSYGKKGEVALQAISDWFDKGYGTKNLDYVASTTEFMTGQSAFMINGVWEVPTLQAKKQEGHNEFGIAPMPSFYNGNHSVWADSHAIAIPNNQGKSLSKEKLAGILAFANYVNQHAIEWGKGGHIPAFEPEVNSAEYQALPFVRDFASDTAQNIVYDPDGWYNGAAGPMQASAAKFFPAAFTGQLTVKNALKRYEKDSRKFLNK
jgi:multiple sugar transport system substrate-binding protein